MGYNEPPELSRRIDEIGERLTDPRAKYRIPKMLHGYFTDLYCCLREMARVLEPGGHAALVVGNVRYCGLSIEVDKFLSAIGEQAGLRPSEIRVARLRGNSAQQMGLYGREVARESVVIFTKGTQPRLFGLLTSGPFREASTVAPAGGPCARPATSGRARAANGRYGG